MTTSHEPSQDAVRVVVALDLHEEECRLIEEMEPRARVVREHGLYHPRAKGVDWNGDQDHERTEDEQRRYDELVDSADVLFGIPDVSPEALARTVRANPRLRWVHGTAAGAGSQVRAADLSPQDLDRVVFTSSAGVHGGPLAEFAIFGLLAGAKDLPRLQALQERHEWAPRWTMRHLEEMTVLVLGLGGIGSAVAARLRAHGAHVLGASRSGTPVDGVDEMVDMADLAAAAARVDGIVVTLPGTEATTGLVGDEVLRAVRPGTILTNVGRGTVVDEAALVRALQDGRIGFAALDVVAEEPLAPDSPLWDLDNVLISPHTAALSRQEDVRIARHFAQNLTRFLDGEPMHKVIDTVEFY